MQRVIRDPRPLQDDPALLEQATALIARHFPPSVAQLFAIPRSGQDGTREWWTELQGQPQRYYDLSAEQQAALLDVHAQRQDALQQLVNELRGRGQAQDAALLQRLVAPPKLDDLYSVNGQPLVIRWSEPPPAPLPAPAVAPAPVIPPRRWIWLPWFLLPLLGLLLLALALWLAWPWLLRWFEPGAPLPEPPVVSEQQACKRPPQELPPEFTVVLDTSGSMQLSVEANYQDEQWFFRNIDNPLMDPQRKALVMREPVRMEVAKQSLTRLIDNLDAAIDMRIVTFDGCRAPIDHGLFPLAQRPALIEGIRRLQPDDGTALAASLEVAASKMNGRDRDGVILMFVDGPDGCDRNVCAVARQIAQEQPRLKVNLVNISHSSDANCVAETTGGRVYNGENAAEVAKALEQASREVTNNCNQE